MSTMLIDMRDGDGMCTGNPGEAFQWIASKRPRESAYRSHDFAILADSVLHPLTPEAHSIAAAYQFILVRGCTEVH